VTAIDAANRPDALPVLTPAIPAVLTGRPRWVVWRWTWIPARQRWSKPPFQARNGRPASTTDPATWASFALACAAYAAGPWDGIGLVLVPEDRLSGIDLDACRDPRTGVLTPAAAAKLARFDSYAEISPSGTGIRILVAGSLAALLPAGRLGLRRGSVEAYSGGRYLTITGHALDDPPLPVRACQRDLADLVSDLLGPPRRKESKSGPQTSAAPTTLTDTEIITRAQSAGNGSKFLALFDRGETDAYDGDASRADQALLSLLAFWTGDAAQLDRLFRRSALYRPKWERADYRARTIATALTGDKVYDPGTPGATLRRRTVPAVRGRRGVIDLSPPRTSHGQ
jgi:primase-polymerase (primpol)-like protein